MSDQVPNTVKYSSRPALKAIFVGFRVMGLQSPKKYKWLLWMYRIILHIIVSICFPLTMILYVFDMDDQKTLFANLSLLTEEIILGLKISNVFIKRKKIFSLLNNLSELDERVRGEDERKYCRYILKMANWFLVGFTVSFGLTGAFDDLALLFANERRLLYPAWFPWDWKNSTFAYRGTQLYQVVGINLQIIMNVTCNLYPAIFYWLLKGHLRALGMRIQKIGVYQTKQRNENYSELVNCIKDHKLCMSYYDLCQDISSRIMFLQFISTQCALCMTAIYLLIIDDDFVESMYLGFYFTSMLAEISLGCYCGSALTEESQYLTHALYSSNWTEQDLRFKKVLIIFMQQTQKSWTIQAGGVVSVSIGTWLTILKSSYSLFVVFRQII